MVIHKLNPWKEWREKESKLNRYFEIIESLEKEHVDHQKKIKTKYLNALNNFIKIKNFQEDKNNKIDCIKKIFLLSILIIAALSLGTIVTVIGNVLFPPSAFALFYQFVKLNIYNDRIKKNDMYNEIDSFCLTIEKMQKDINSLKCNLKDTDITQFFDLYGDLTYEKSIAYKFHSLALPGCEKPIVEEQQSNNNYAYEENQPFYY